MWTLDDINKFVCAEEVKAKCPSCKTGMITFRPAISFYANYDDGRAVTQAEVNAQGQSKSCQCDYGDAYFKLEAKVGIKFEEKFALLKRSAPRTEAEDAAHREEVLAGKVY